MEEEYRREIRRQQEEQLRELYRLRHDMGAKVSVVYRQIQKKAYKEAEENLKRIGDEWRDYPELPEDTGNEGLNAALMAAVYQCREKRIRFHYAVLGNISGIDSLDMGSLIHNLLHNGIEACDKVQGERELELVVRREGNVVEVDLDNTINASVLNKNPSLKTSKEEKEKHGFGMETIREIVKHYGGSYTFWEEGKRLIQSIVLKTEREE